MTDDDHERIEQRAERLRVLTAAIGEEPEMAAGECARYGLVPGGWNDTMRGEDPTAYPDDLHLAWECAELAQAIRTQQWTALQLIGIAYHAPEPPAALGGMTTQAGMASEPTRLVSVERRDLLALAHAVLGWDLPGEPLLPVSEEVADYADRLADDD